MLDEQTLFASAASSIGLCGALLYVARPKGSGLDPLGWWSAAMALGAAGVLLIVLPLPLFITRDLSKALLLLSVAASWTAARVFVAQRPSVLVALCGTVLWLAVCRVPAFDASPSAQLALSCLLGGIYTLATAIALWPVGAEGLQSHRAAIMLLGTHAAIYLGRGLLAVSGLDRGWEHNLTALMMLEAPLHTIGMAFTLLAMSKERVEKASAVNLAVARQASEARRRFVAHMSHEVRTPLNGVLGLAQVLSRDVSLRGEQRRHVETLEAAGRHLMAVVNDALDLAKIDAGRFDIVARPFNPTATASASVMLVRTAAVDKQLDLRLRVAEGVPPAVSGDATRLQQILLNLLWNAVKFTPEGGQINLVIDFEDGLRFSVIDDGPGIPPDKVPQLFRDFAQIASGSGGTGLGLAISARLAHSLGGDISYEPRQDRTGAVFRVALPWREAVLLKAETVAEAALPPNGLTILVVDDVRANRLLLRAMLQSGLHTVVEAIDGLEAIGIAAGGQVDLVLMDVHMPGMDGLEASRRIRRLPGPPSTVPIVAVSADAMPETEQECREAGMNAVVTKPVEHAALLAAIARVVSDPAIRARMEGIATGP